MKILLVDDEPSLLKALFVRLRHWGYDVVVASDGLKALDGLRQHMPDLLILDKEMPEMNGDEVARIAKQDAQLKHIPIILISADAENLALSARECGVAAYLSKPFEADELRALIKTLVPPQEKRQESET